MIWGQQGDYLSKQLRDYRGGDRDNQIMSSIAESLTDADITALAAFFAGKSWPAATGASAAALPETAAVCQSCHQANYMGGQVPDIGVAPRLAGQHAGYLRDTMEAYANGERANSTVMPAMMTAIDAKDRQAIADALSRLGSH